MSSDFGEWLKAELAKRGWSMRQLALRAGVHPASVTNIVRTGATPRIKSILKTAQAPGEDQASTRGPATEWRRPMHRRLAGDRLRCPTCSPGWLLAWALLATRDMSR